MAAGAGGSASDGGLMGAISSEL